MNLKKRKIKKAVSPIVATVLLISIVLVLGMIVFLWMRGITKEAITKFGNENIELACEKINFEAGYSYSGLDISNTGTVPILKFKIKIFSDESYTTEEINEPLPAGKVNSVSDASLPSSISSAEKIILIPVLLGNSNKGQASYVCDEKYGEEITI